MTIFNTFANDITGGKAAVTFSFGVDSWFAFPYCVAL
jgi:hypothetical protein